MNIKQLASLEEKWLKTQRGLAGDRETLYEQAGVYAAWQKIFGQYVALAREGDLEALKRALYFAWARRSIGHLVTGIKDLDEDLIGETLGIADGLARNSRLDAELEWMLPYYYLVDRSYLDRYQSLDALRQASCKHAFLYRQRCLESSFDHRGQMGEYWKVTQAHLRRWRQVSR
jgi:hypothetical protein